MMLDVRGSSLDSPCNHRVRRVGEIIPRARCVPRARPPVRREITRNRWVARELRVLADSAILVRGGRSRNEPATPPSRDRRPPNER